MDLFQIYKAADKVINDAKEVYSSEITLNCDDKNMSFSIPELSPQDAQKDLGFGCLLSLLSPLFVGVFLCLFGGEASVAFGALFIVFGIACAIAGLKEVLPNVLYNYQERVRSKSRRAELEVLFKELPYYTEMYTQEAKRLEKEDEKEWNRIKDMGFPSNAWFLRLGENNVCVPILYDSRFFYNDKCSYNGKVNTFAHITYLRVPEGIQKYLINTFCIRGIANIYKYSSMIDLHTLLLPRSIQVIDLSNSLLHHLEIPSSVTSIYGVSRSLALDTLIVVLNNGINESVVMKVLKNSITERTKVYLKWDNFLWNPQVDNREDLFAWKEDFLNLDSQIQNGNGTQPFHISGDHLFRANKFKISFIEG